MCNNLVTKSIVTLFFLIFNYFMTARAENNVEAPKISTRPVVFIHGYNSNSGAMNKLVEKFQNAGYNSGDLYNYDYSNNIHQHISKSGEEFRDYIKKTFGDKQIDIVAHSMGGLVARYAVKNFLHGQVIHIAVLGTPSHGASYADWCPGPVGGICSEAVFDMAQKSAFLANLNKGNEAPPPTRFLTYRTPCDNIVREDSVPLNGAHNERVDLCNTREIRHSKEKTNSKVKPKKEHRGSDSGVHNALTNNEEVFEGVLEFFQHSDSFRPDVIYQLVVGRNGLMVDLRDGTGFSNGVTSEGSAIIQFYSNGGINQKWKLVPHWESGWYFLKNMGSGLYLTPSSNSYRAGMVQKSYSGATAWRFIPKDSVYLMGAASSGYLLHSGSNDASYQLIQEGNHGGGALNFYLREDSLPKKDHIYQIISVNSDKVIDLLNGTPTNDNAPIVQWEGNNGAGQRWKLLRNDDGTYSLQVQNSGKKCLAREANSNKIVQRSCNIDEAKWRIERNDDSSYRIGLVENGNVNRVLDVPESSKQNGTQLIVYPFHNTRNQKWSFDLK